MGDYSDLIMLIGAMVIFSFLSRNASHMFYQSDTAYFQSDVEYEAIALAQSIIDEVKWTTEAADLSSLAAAYNGTTETVSVDGGSYTIDYSISMTVSDVTVTGSLVTNKKVNLKVTSEFLPDSSYIKMEYIKNFSS